jgi:DNA repair protein RadC
MAASNYRIMDLQENDRPRERLAEVGPRALNSAELLAILLRVGVVGENAVQMGHRLLKTFGGLAGLQKATFVEISSQRGIGPAKAAQIMAAMELGRRLASDMPVENRTPISSPKDAADLVQYEMSALIHEELWVLLLDTRNRVNRIERLYKGSLNSSTVRIAELFRPAIQYNAASIIMIHNHPSGDPSPSPEDIQLTRSAVMVGRQMDIPVLDHLVIGSGRYVSLKDRRLGFD